MKEIICYTCKWQCLETRGQQISEGCSAGVTIAFFCNNANSVFYKCDTKGVHNCIDWEDGRHGL